MSSCNCFICGDEINSDKVLIGDISICLKCIGEADPQNDFEMVKDIIDSYKKSSTDRKNKKNDLL